MDPLAMSDDDLAAHLTTLNDEQLSDVIAQVDAAEVVSKNRAIDMKASALWYAVKLDWPVFPLKPRGKKPMTANGFKAATTDPAQIETWWEQHPDANIGVPTGPTVNGGCGYDVIDVDGQTGMSSWWRIKHRDCPPDCAAEVYCPAPGPFDVSFRAFTPGNGVDRGPGRHFYLPATGKGNAAGLDDGIDWRGTGGYVVAPPSVGLNGARYSWLTRPTP